LRSSEPPYIEVRGSGLSAVGRTSVLEDV
jgi:hypothetical protein